MKLTVKQQRFADEYIRLGEVTKAAINAGYSIKSAYAVGSENLKKPSIKSYIDKRLEELKKESIAEQDEILQYLTSVMRGETTEQTLVAQGEGYQEIDNIDVGAKDRIKAAELLGKRYRMWTEKVEAEVTTPIFVDDVPEDD
ncbi:terminase small subunit [Staphylococcus epidermidis]|uniref:terminase small subunit n=1 Tax=Staphylococcus epidermidis TaxID=1282 RepID=UPI00026C0D17|nr:terminase small subunit [Staphylococcus epidermidis]EJD81225.1 terminase small subunit [Staphylococcus epidermidis NIHLM095]EJD84206.1 terminase small subunit [Staphylococcus epidermidis NIHLM087]QNL84806.1 terminase [Staphylococcus epidermidis]WEE07864.1 terminase small subunit [Staphylococcus epidermidis]